MIKKPIHQHSRKAYTDMRNTLTKREIMIYNILAHRGAMTDRQIKDVLGFDDMNAVRPRVTDLKTKKLVVECGSTIDPVSRKSVRVVRLANINEFEKKEESAQMSLFN